MFLSKLIGDKKRWRAYRARSRRLPSGYCTAVEEIEHYLFHFMPTDSDSMATMFEDLADLFEQAAASGTPSAESSGRTRWSSSRRSRGTTRRAVLSLPRYGSG